MLGERVDQLFDAETLQRAAEIDRGEIACAIGFDVELRIADPCKLGVLGERLGQRGTGLAKVP